MTRNAILTVDLGFGDAGKGSVVDFLCRATDAHTVVRYNGGAQAGHRVVTAEATARDHVFSQFGSGTLAGARAHLSRFMLLEPLAMEAEEAHLRALGVADGFGRTTIDEGALVVTPFHRALNRLRELARGAARHGSCGLGIGEAMSDWVDHGAQVVLAGDLAQPDVLRRKLRFVHALNLEKLRALESALPDTPQVLEEKEWLTDEGVHDWLIERYRAFAARVQIVPGDFLNTLLAAPGTVVFEGAQGVLLDEWRGFHPHTTWSTTTLANADQLVAEAGYEGQVTRLGLTRAYATRHGAGPFVTEDAALARALPDACNGTHAWQQSFRVGWLDLVMLRYAAQVVGRLDGLAATCLDRVAALPELYVCDGYRLGGLTVSNLAPSPTPRDLAYQAQLTQSLVRCQPILERVADPATLLQRVAERLRVPVCLVSEGPTAEAKRVVAPELLRSG